MAKKKQKKCKGKCKELYYQGVASLTINTFNEKNREKYVEAIGKVIMTLHKCRIALYPTLNIGAPHCGPHGCS